MGGFGSGRSSTTGQRPVEAFLAIDINFLKREGCLEAGRTATMTWHRDGESIGTINVVAASDRLHLTYRSRSGDEDWHDVAETVPIERVACHFGGERSYFNCPGVVDGHACNSRVSKLYARGAYFLCRRCHRLVYATQRLDELDRARRRASKIRRRLGGRPGCDEIFPERPKGMWHQTYERRLDALQEAEVRAEEVFIARGARLLARLGHPDFAGF